MPEIKEHLIVLAKLYLDQGEYGKLRELLELLEHQEGRKPEAKPEHQPELPVVDTSPKIETSSLSMMRLENLDIVDVLNAVSKLIPDDFTRSDLRSVIKTLYPQLDRYAIGRTKLEGTYALANMCYDRLTGRIKNIPSPVESLMNSQNGHSPTFDALAIH